MGSPIVSRESISALLNYNYDRVEDQSDHRPTGLSDILDRELNDYDRSGLTPSNNYGLPVGTIVRGLFCQLLWTWSLLFVTIGWVAFTILFASNCIRSASFSSTLLFSDPTKTVLALNVLSHVTILLLRELTASIFDVIRWTLASSPNGISLGSFISLSRATGLVGVLSLLLERIHQHSVPVRHGPWGPLRQLPY